MEVCPVPVVRAAYRYFRSRFEFCRKRFAAGFGGLLRTQQDFEQIGYANIPEINEYLSGLGGRYYFFGEYTVCRRYLEAAPRYPALSVRARVASLNTLGLCYQHLGQYRQVQRIFDCTR